MVPLPADTAAVISSRGPENHTRGLVAMWSIHLRRVIFLLQNQVLHSRPVARVSKNPSGFRKGAGLAPLLFSPCTLVISLPQRWRETGQTQDAAAASCPPLFQPREGMGKGQLLPEKREPGTSAPFSSFWEGSWHLDLSNCFCQSLAPWEKRRRLKWGGGERCDQGNSQCYMGGRSCRGQDSFYLTLMPQGHRFAPASSCIPQTWARWADKSGHRCRGSCQPWP